MIALLMKALHMHGDTDTSPTNSISTGRRKLWAVPMAVLMSMSCLLSSADAGEVRHIKRNASTQPSPQLAGGDASITFSLVVSSVATSGSQLVMKYTIGGADSWSMSCSSDKAGGFAPSGDLATASATLTYTVQAAWVGSKTTCTWSGDNSSTGGSNTSAVQTISFTSGIPPTMDSVARSTSPLVAGKPYTMYWSSSNATRVYRTCTHPSSAATGESLPAQGPANYTAAFEDIGTTTCRWTAINAANASSAEWVETVTTRAPLPLPTIDTVVRNPDPMVAGQSYTLTWRTTNAESLTRSCTSPGAGFGPAETLPVNNSVTDVGRADWVGVSLQCKWIATNESGSTERTEYLRTVAAPFNDAKVLSDVPPPSVIKAGSSYTYQVTLQNTGNTTWTPGTTAPYRLGFFGSAAFGLSRIELPTSVSPGGQITLTLNATIPATAVPGTYQFQWQMVQEGVAWFGMTTANRSVTIQGIDSATFVSHVPPPATMKLGQAYSYSVTMKNSGSSTWPAGTSYVLGATSPALNTNWGTARISLPVSVPPDGQYTFTFSSTVPSDRVPGSYDFEWQMVNGNGEWFGGRSPRTSISISTPVPLPTIDLVSRSPDPMVVDQPWTLTWRTTNAATLKRACTSPSAGYGAEESMAVSGSASGTGRADWVGSVLECRWTATNETGSATYTEYLRTNAAPFNDAKIISDSLTPASLKPGQSYTYTVTLQNTGSTTWVGGTATAHRLGFVGSAALGISRIDLPASVAPGAQTTLSLTSVVPAGTAPGAYNVQWQMLQGTAGWFGATTTARSLTVAGANSATFVSQVLPPAVMQRGQAYSYSVTMKNSGTTTWPAGATYVLGAINPSLNTNWGTARISLPASVPPGAQQTFSFNSVIPADRAPGQYNFQWQMLQEGVEWFGGASANATITISQPALPYDVVYIHTDGLGSPVARTDQNGAIISKTSYEPYGLTAAGATPTIGFTGHVNDADTGLVYMQQRYYDPVAGRFLSIDPVTTDANSGSSFNRYSYAYNSPYRYTDPDGRDAAERFVERHRIDVQSGNGAVYEPLVPVAVGGLIAVNGVFGYAAVYAIGGPAAANTAVIFVANLLSKAAGPGPKPPPHLGPTGLMRQVRIIKREADVLKAKPTPASGPAPTPPPPPAQPTPPVSPGPSTPPPPPPPSPPPAPL